MSANLAILLRAGSAIAIARDEQYRTSIIGKGPRGEKGDPGGNIMAIGLLTDASGLSIPLGTDAVRTSGHTLDGVGIADYVADATVNTAYVAAHPRSSFITTNGRGFRLAISGIGAVAIEKFGGVADGATDNAPAFNAIVALMTTGALVSLGSGTYNFSSLVIPSFFYVLCYGRNATFIQITGDGGGAPGNGVNGGVQMFGTGSGLSECLIQYTNPSLQCLLNVSSVSGSGDIRLQGIIMRPAPSLASTDCNCLAAYMAALTAFEWVEGLVGPGFMQDLHIGGSWNGCNIRGVTFQALKLDIPNGVFHTRNPLVNIDASTQGSSFQGCTFEQGPNGIAVRGGGTFNIFGGYMADAAISKGFWVPGLVVSQGSLIYPSSVVTTGSIVTGISTTTLNVASAASLYKGMKIVIPGAGAAAANLTARITAIAGTAITISVAASTDVTSVNIYAGAYVGHGYIAKTAGTTGTSQPTFPTTAAGEVADNTTTWREHGSCAWIDTTPGIGIGHDNVTVIGVNIFSSIIGILGMKNGAVVPANTIYVEGCDLFGPDYLGYFDSVGSTVLVANKLRSYQNVGFEFHAASVTNAQVTGCYTLIGSAADVVAAVLSSNFGGMVQGGNVNVTGLGVSRFNVNTINTVFNGFIHPGSITSLTAIGYGAGAGGTAAQTGAKTNGVTLNKICGQITMNAGSLAANTPVSFTFTNNQILPDDRLAVWVKSGNAAVGSYRVAAEGNANGSRKIVVENKTGGALAEALVLGFEVTKAVIS